jgi:hypothetical protein
LGITFFPYQRKPFLTNLINNDWKIMTSQSDFKR